jgi:hypothetical protein
MSSANRSQPPFDVVPQLAGQSSPARSSLAVSEPIVGDDFVLVLRVKPDRRRTQAAVPPEQDRRRG